MKCVIELEDNEDGRPVYTEQIVGPQDESSMAYSVFVVLKMVMFLINSRHRNDIVNHISKTYRAMKAEHDLMSGATVPGDHTCH